MTVRSRLPLPALLSQVLLSLSLEFERAGAGRHPVPGLEVWSNLLRCVGEVGTTERELRELTRLSRRAVRARVGNAVRRGWLRVESGKPGSAAAVLGLTDLGHDVRRAWPGLAEQAVGGWSARAGEGDVSALQAVSRGLVGRLELELPHFPASYGTADWRITGDSGQDWRPVRRGDRDTVGDLPLPALLSQILVAFTMEYETEGGCLALDANVLRFLGPTGSTGSTGRPVTALPRQLGDGLSALVRHGFVETYRDPARGGRVLVRLVDRGLRAYGAYRPRLAAIERRWGRRYGVGSLRRSLEAIVHRLDLDLPHHPIGVVDPRTGLLLR